MKLPRGVKRLAWRFSPNMYRWLQGRERQEFSVGIAVGDSPFALKFPASIANPVVAREHVTDVPAVIVADPFMLHDGRRWYLFLEIVNHFSGKGEIGLAVSDDALTWEYRSIVLREQFHLSYPYVFEWEGGYYMLPECAQSGAVHLYRALEFPDRWERVGELLNGGRYVDSSLLFHDGRCWLFTDTGAHPSRPELSVFYSDRPQGPWQPHALNPIRKGDPHLTRPSGRLVVVDGTPIRFAQDIYPTYGASVSAFAITRLTPTEYAEQRIGDAPILATGPGSWQRDGMHHVDAHQRADGSWIACVDGFQLREGIK
jgi:hypothetical protein